MSVVYDHLGAHLPRGEVVNAACSIRNVSKEQGLCSREPACQLVMYHSAHLSTMSAIAHPYIIRPSGI